MKKETLDKLAEYILELVFASGVGQTASAREPTQRAKQLYNELTQQEED